MRIPVPEDFLKGAVSVERKDGFIQPWRVPHTRRALFPSDEAETLVDRMSFAAGIRLRFSTEGRSLSLGVMEEDSERRFDLVDAWNCLLETKILPPGENTVKFKLPEGNSKEFEIWLPQNSKVGLKELEAEDGAMLSPAGDNRLRWTAYGSSITQCSAARSPSRTWPGTASRTHNINLTCLGFGGQCHAEPMLGIMIRDIPADIITLKLGINILGGSSLTRRTFKAAAIGLVRIIREKQPETPIGLISPIICPSREETPNTAGFTLQMMRTELRDAAERIKKADGDLNLFYFDGRELFGEELAENHLPDGLHPDADGYELMGQNASRLVIPALLEKVRTGERKP